MEHSTFTPNLTPRQVVDEEFRKVVPVIIDNLDNQ
jgi:hypothetical protein